MEQDAETIARTDLADALRGLEADLPSQIPAPQNGPLAPNGASYVQITAGIRQPWYASPAQAIAAWRVALVRFSGKHRGDTLWWRVAPEIGVQRGRWMVYSRLMIGNAA